MTDSILSQHAQDMIRSYESLTFGTHMVVCPYFNNKRQHVRGALRATIGKGSPQEIVEEATLFALKERVDLTSLDPSRLSQFLVDHALGIDCSGFVYHVLNAEYTHTKGVSLSSQLSFSSLRSPFRRILARLRPAENTNVNIFADMANSTPISLEQIHAGDIITLIGSNTVGNPDHILLVTEVKGCVISYAHAYKFSHDGMYDHGIKHGTITITDPTLPLDQQVWDAPQMLQILRNATQTDIRRVRAS